MFRWFKRGAPEGAGDQPPDEAPPGEAENVAKIQHLCWIAGISGETIADARAHGGIDGEHLQYEIDRYTRYRAEAVQLADTITHEFYRGWVIRLLIDLCMKAGDIDDARSLFKYQEVEVFREGIVEDHPEIVRPRISDIMSGR